MRHSTLLLSIAATLVVGTSVAVYANSKNNEREREHKVVEIRNLALCEKSLEIAASFSSYASRNADPITAKRYVELADSIEMANAWYTTALNTDHRHKAYELGFSKVEYDSILAAARYEAEADVVARINDAIDPMAKATEIAQSCLPWHLGDPLDD